MKKSSLALAAFISSVAVACALFALAIVYDAQLFKIDIFLASTPDAPETEGGDGFVSGDDCGFVMGSSGLNSGAQILFDTVDDVDQGCVDNSGYFYKDKVRSSTASHSTLGEIDFAPGPDSTKYVKVNQTTGEWSGYAKISSISKDAGSYQWVWFDWTCDTCIAADYENRVHTDMTTGEVTGLAWSDYLDSLTPSIESDGYISFDGLEQELPARNVSMKVDVLSVDVLSDEDVFPEDATISNAPLADGFEYWQVRVQFLDNDTGAYLDEDDIVSLSLDVVPTSTSQMYLDHTKNIKTKMSGVKDTPINSAAGCSTASGYCAETEDDDSTSFNTYVFAGAPTSNMVGVDDDSDDAIEYPTDRDGCIWFYEDQWSSGDTSEPTCPRSGGSDYDKGDVFYDRDASRNQYIMNYVTATVTFDPTRDITIDTSGDVSWDGEKYTYDFTGDGEELSFRPRFQVQKFAAKYDGYEYTTSISTDMEKSMQLITEATIEDFSEEYKSAGGSTLAPLKIYYQLEAESSSGGDAVSGDYYFLIDSNDPVDEDIDDSVRTDTMTTIGDFYKSYAIGYGQKGCVGGCPPYTGNTLSSPTVEQWVCDAATASDKSFGQMSCYFTAYLTILDRHTDAAEMTVLGAINSTVDQNDFFESNAEDEDYSILGAVNVINLRNKMYAQIARYTLGQTANGGSVDLSSSLSGSSVVVSLMNERLLYAEKDVHVTGGGSGFTDKTLVVVGGDVYLESNITGGKLGVIALRSGGSGGNVYVSPSVTDIYANMYLDGSLFSYSGAKMSDGVTPKWSNDEVRLEGLQNQLYLKGSLMSRNTVGGSGASSSPYPKGDGSDTTSYAEAVEYDLNMLRQFRQCYDLTSTGELDTSLWGLCDEGEELSTYGNDNADYSSMIIEYDPAGDLPIFVVEEGLFN